MKPFPRILALGLGALFLYAGALKAWDPAAFANEVFHYRLLPWGGAVLVALYLPWLEAVCGLALVVRRCTLPALVILTSLMSMFVLAIASAKFRGLNITCGCFGSAVEPGSLGWVLVRDAAILAGLGRLLWEARKQA